MTYRPPVFSVKDNPRYWKNYLYNEGYVVLNDILTENQQVDLFTTFKNDLNQVSPNFDFDNKETWTIENTPIMFGKGMALYNGLGQSDFMWKLRTHKNIQYPFQTLFGTQHLVSSLDGFSLFVSDKQKPKSWLHIDQNPQNNAYSVQAAYNLFPVESGDAGFVVVPKSHKTFKPIPKNKVDWIVVDQDLFNPKALKLLIPKNCLTIWNSRLVHANAGIVKTKNNVVNEKINRLTAYITFLPKSTRSDKVKQARIETYKLGKTTSHWSNRCEVKTYPYGFKKLYESRGFNTLAPRLTENGEIPCERLELL